jgi:hypothetical protein
LLTSAGDTFNSATILLCVHSGWLALFSSIARQIISSPTPTLRHTPELTRRNWHWLFALSIVVLLSKKYERTVMSTKTWKKLFFLHLCEKKGEHHVYGFVQIGILSFNRF